MCGKLPEAGDRPVRAIGREVSYVDGTEQGDLAQPDRSAQRPRPDLWSRHLSEDYAAEHPGVSVLLDKSRSIAYHQRFVTAFPDIRFEVQGVLAEGDRVLIQWTAAVPTPNVWPPSRGGPSPLPGAG